MNTVVLANIGNDIWITRENGRGIVVTDIFNYLHVNIEIPNNLRSKLKINNDKKWLCAFKSEKYIILADDIIDEISAKMHGMIENRNILLQSLLDIITNMKSDVNDSFKYIAEFFGSYDYSLWLYNKNTRYFGLASTASQGRVLTIKLDDSQNPISELFESKSYYTSREPFRENTIIDGGDDIHSINRWRIIPNTEFTTDTEAIFTLFHKEKGVVIEEGIREVLAFIINNYLMHRFYPRLKIYHLFLEKFQSEYSIGNFKRHLLKYIDTFRKLIGFEALSIWIEDENSECLAPFAISEHGEKGHINAPCYYLHDDSLTRGVYHSGKYNVVYQINEDTRNSHRYDEKTAHDAVNWIGFPIVSVANNKKSIGVIRAKNCVYKNELVNIENSDIELIGNFASIISHYIDIDEHYRNELSREKKSQENLTAYIRTFQHEIKTPLMTVTQAKSTILNCLREEKLIQPRSVNSNGEDIVNYPVSLHKKLTDLMNVGKRVSFIAGIHSFDPDDVIIDPRSHNLRDEIIMPVLTFAVPYAEKRKRGINYTKDDLNVRVFCDAPSIGMAFHALIDNAVKYSNKNEYTKERKLIRPISVIISKHPDLIDIDVSNYGISIASDEEEYIFDQFHRGKNAIENRISGSGVGLFIAKTLISANSGELKLIKTSNPVVFRISLPRSQDERKKPDVKRNYHKGRYNSGS